METNTETLTKFLASLPAALTRRGPNRANDVTLAKTMRAELALAVTAGIFPAGTTFSVRINHYASLTVEIKTWTGPVFSAEYETHLADPIVPDPTAERFRPRETDGYHSLELYAAMRTAESICERHNYDNSDIMTDYFDVGYYLTVSVTTIDNARRAAIKLAINPEFGALLLKARAAAEALGRKATASILGRVGLESASEWELQRLLKVAARADGKPVVYDKRRRGWFPVTA